MNGSTIPSAPDYMVQWYAGTTTNIPLTDAAIGGNGTLSGTNTATVSGIPAGFYTVAVQNTSTGCISTETYQLINDPHDDFPINVSMNLNTNCANPNGLLMVRTLDNMISSYDYYWFVGAETNPDTTRADFSGVTNIDSLDVGQYTVVVVEKADRYCTSVEIMDVEGKTFDPKYTLEVVHHHSLCSDGIGNGFARAIDYNLNQTSFVWTSISNNDTISTTHFAGSLAPGKL